MILVSYFECCPVNLINDDMNDIHIGSYSIFHLYYHRIIAKMTKTIADVYFMFLIISSYMSLCGVCSTQCATRVMYIVQQ